MIKSVLFKKVGCDPPAWEALPCSPLRDGEGGKVAAGSPGVT